MSTVIVFVDTNVFIELNDLKDLRWRDLFATADEVHIMIARSVIKELQKHKVSDKERQRKRARLALRMIRDAIGQPGLSTVLRPSGPRVVLTVPRIKIKWKGLDELDPDEPDDRLVAEAVSYGSGAVLLSDDTDPHASAAAVGLKVFEPPDDWHFTPPPSEKDKEITKLKSQLAASQQTKPQLKLEFTLDRSHFRIPILQPLPGHDINLLARRYREANPREVRTSGYWIGAPHERAAEIRREVEAYANAYVRFEQNVETYFEKLHTQLMTQCRCLRLRFLLANEGIVGATDLQLETRVEGAWLVASMHEDFLGTLKPPKPPIFRRKPSIFGKSVVEVVQGVDPQAFGWILQPVREAKRSIRLCRNFNPGIKYPSEELCFVDGEFPREVKVRQILTGVNLTGPMLNSIVVTAEEEQATFKDEWVLAMLPEPIRDCFTGKAKKDDEPQWDG